VTDNAQSVFELSRIEKLPNISAELKEILVSSPTSAPRNWSSKSDGAATPSRPRPTGFDRHRRGRLHDDDFRHHHAARNTSLATPWAG